MPIHRLTIPNWRPARTNELICRHWSRARLRKKGDAEMVAGYALASGLPPATGKRLVSLEITLSGRQQRADKDAYWKSLLDALCKAGLLVDDGPDWCELGAVVYFRGERPATTIVLQDMGES